MGYKTQLPINVIIKPISKRSDYISSQRNLVFVLGKRTRAFLEMTLNCYEIPPSQSLNEFAFPKKDAGTARIEYKT